MKDKLFKILPYIFLILFYVGYLEFRNDLHPAPVVQAVSTAADAVLGINEAESACVPVQTCIPCYGSGASFVCGECGGLEDDVQVACSGGCLTAVWIW